MRNPGGHARTGGCIGRYRTAARRPAAVGPPVPDESNHNLAELTDWKARIPLERTLRDLLSHWEEKLRLEADANRSHEGVSGDQKSADHRHHRPGRLLPGRAAAGQGLRGPRHRSAAPAPSTRRRIDHLYEDPHEAGARLFLHYGDLTDASRSEPRCSRGSQPDEIYNLGAQSHVRVSFDMPEYTADVDGLGTLRLLEAIRNAAGRVRFYQASSSEMFGEVAGVPADRDHAVPPAQPLRRRQGLRLLDHGQLPRGLRHVRLQRHPLQPRVARAAARPSSPARSPAAWPRIKAGLQDKLYLGNLDAKRDWGFAGDYVEAMWLMLQQDEPDDYVIATGETHSVREFVEEAFGLVGLDWRGVRRDRPALLPAGRGRPAAGRCRARPQRELGWQAQDHASTNWSG